ncbi:MAG: hypothetical protein HZC50_02495 [Nitrospirae bacterium]|nr:hypothetical protein [Nitrospirota bacterium]
MRLTIAIPEAQVVEAPTLLRIVRMAPACDIEAGEQGAAYVAVFEDFPKSVEIVVRLIEEAWDLRDVQITLGVRPVVSRINFYVALLCYRGSLGVPDAEAYCFQQAAKVGTDGGCPDRSCLSHCHCRAIRVRLRCRFSSWIWRARQKWTGVRTSASRSPMRELSRDG